MHLTRPAFLSRTVRACAVGAASAALMVVAAPNAQLAQAEGLRSGPACPLTTNLVSPQLETALACWQQLLVGKTIVAAGQPVGPNQISASDLPQEDARVLGPDTPASLDYVANRLDIMTDAQGLITKVTLG